MNVPQLGNSIRRAFGFILGARGGAKGHVPFPAPRTDRFIVGMAKVEHARRPRLVINTTPQPWQKHAAKLLERAKSHRPPLSGREKRTAAILAALKVA